MAVTRVKSEIAGAVWKILKQSGDTVAAEETLLLVESMKMEIPIAAPHAGMVTAILVREGEMVAEGDVVAVIAA